MQLTILGYILVPIFTYNLWWLVIGYSLIMALVGAYESISRPAYTFKASLLQNQWRLCDSFAVVSRLQGLTS